MLYEVMKHVRNFFIVPNCVRSGRFEIVNGAIDCPFLQNGQFFLLTGSVLNDGVYQYPAQLVDEAFTGTISGMSVPTAFLDLVRDIEEFERNNTVTPFQSESFNGYSYTRASGANGGAASWKDAFRGRLNTWRKI